MRDEPGAAGERSRQRECERAGLELAGDRADAEADGEEPAAEQEDRMLEPDRRPLRERIEPDQIQQAAELLGLRLELLREDLARGEDGDEQEAPRGDQDDLERQAHPLLADQAGDQRSAHAVASSR